MADMTAQGPLGGAFEVPTRRCGVAPPRPKPTVGSLTCRRAMAAFAGAAAGRDALRGRSGSPIGGFGTLGGRILAAGRSRDAHSQLARRRARFRLIFALILPDVPAGDGPY